MIAYSHQKRSLHPMISVQPLSIRYDQRYLTRILEQGDPFLQRLHSFASVALHDHPYPKTPKEFNRRTLEIEKKIQNLKLSSYDKNFLHHLVTETGVSLVDLWQGSHIIIFDNGHLYNLWSNSRKAHPRFSSHYRHVSTQQYGIHFKNHQLLFGKTSVNGPTWLQMEAHSFDPNRIIDDPNLVINHGHDFLKYRYHKMNVGPCGFSPHTEQNPIKLSYKPLTRKLTVKIRK